MLYRWYSFWKKSRWRQAYSFCGRSWFDFEYFNRACLKTLKPTPNKGKVTKFGVSNAWNMAKAFKNRSSKKGYLSTRQLTFVTFESPFSQKLPANNRWVQLAENIPWDDIIDVYNRQLNNTKTGASNINPRVVIGALMVKHLLNLINRDTILAIH